MKRLAAFIALLLALGFVTTVGVAWLYATMIHPDDGRNRFSSWTRVTREEGRGLEFVGPGKHMLVATEWRAPAPDVVLGPIEGPAWSDVLDRTEGRAGIDDARGWPWLALRCRWSNVGFDGPLVDPAACVEGGIVVAPLRGSWVFEKPIRAGSFVIWWEAARALPLVPIVPGLVGDVLVWAAAWWVVFVAVRAPAIARRWRRRTGERCRRCGYPLRAGDEAPCSECGCTREEWLPIFGTWSLVAAALLVVALAGGVGAGASALAARAAPGPMHRAAARNDVERLEELLADGADPDEGLDDVDLSLLLLHVGTRPIDWAAEAGAADAIEVLLAAGASFDAGEWPLDTPVLERAVRSDDLDSVRLLLDAGAGTIGDRIGEDVLCIAARGSNRAMVRFLVDELRERWGPGEFSATPALVAALEAGRVEYVGMLIEAGADLDQYPHAAVLLAVKSGRLDLLEEVLRHGASPFAAPECVWEAVSRGRADLTKALLDAGADPDAIAHAHPGWSPLREAIRQEHLDIARDLVAAGADPTLLDNLHRSLLFDLDWFGDPDVVDFVLGLGIDVTTPSSTGETALHEAIRMRSVRGTRAMLDAGADPHAADRTGETPLDRARRLAEYASTHERLAWSVEVRRLVEAAARRAEEADE